MIKQLGISNLSGLHFVYVAFVFYANYQVLKWIFKAIKATAKSDLLAVVIFKLTPMSVVRKREVRRKLQLYREKEQKEKQHQEALESHRKYKAPFFNLQFISEDRATLFKGFEIKWQEGNQKVGQSKKSWVVENRELAFAMFQEVAAFRWQFQKQGKWTPEMERFWLKILPKQFVSKQMEMTEIEKAIIDFDDDIPTKASA